MKTFAQPVELRVPCRADPQVQTPSTLNRRKAPRANPFANLSKRMPLQIQAPKNAQRFASRRLSRFQEHLRRHSATETNDVSPLHASMVTAARELLPRIHMRRAWELPHPSFLPHAPNLPLAHSTTKQSTARLHLPRRIEPIFEHKHLRAFERIAIYIRTTFTNRDHLRQTRIHPREQDILLHLLRTP